MSVPPQRRLRRPLLIVVAAAAIVALTALLLGSHSVRVGYHDWRMQADLAAHLSQEIQYYAGIGSIDVGSDYKAYEYHRDCLVDLGAVCKHEVVYSHIHRPSPEATHLVKWLLRDDDPRFIGWQGSPIYDNGEPVAFTFWCYPKDSEACLRLLQDRDVPDYAAAYMSVKGE